MKAKRLRLPATRFQPETDIFQSVVAPKCLAIDDDEGRAEHAAPDRGVDLRSEAFFDISILQSRPDLVRVVAKASGDLDHFARIGDAQALAECPVIEGQGQILGLSGPTPGQPIEGLTFP